MPFGTAFPTGSSSALQVSAGAPEISSVPSGRPGFRLVQVPIKASVRTNGTFAVDHSQFILVDRAGRNCEQPSINPLSNGFVALTVDESRTGAGSVAFLVPSATVLAQLSVRYLPAVDATSATLSWRDGAAAPSPTKPPNGCDGAKAKISGSGSLASFGSSLKHGNGVASTSVQAGTPKRRAFKPGPTQPNDVDAIDVRLKVSAEGADAFVDRRSFALVDGSGRLCRSSELGSQGETLTSALVKKGHSKDYTVVFWAPKGAPYTACGWWSSRRQVAPRRSRPGRTQSSP
ncbi:hypothetical protein [Flexivirga alba]|uniref:DUF4232 domain-containing protein n=1 Tax=Flexivirga alba TaxID=702742 RepID=A0ABW2AGD2_9MICO